MPVSASSSRKARASSTLLALRPPCERLAGGLAVGDFDVLVQYEEAQAVIGTPTFRYVNYIAAGQADKDAVYVNFHGHAMTSYGNNQDKPSTGPVKIINKGHTLSSMATVGRSWTCPMK